MMTLAGKNLRLFPVGPRKSKGCRRRLLFTRPCGAWPCGFSVMWPQRRVRAVPCLHRSRASAGGLQGKVNRCGHPVPPSVCRDFPVVHPLRFRGLTLQLPSAVRVRLRLPLAPLQPCRPGKDGGTAPPGVAEYVNNGGKHHAICETCHSEC